MTDQFVPVPGDAVELSDLNLEKAKNLADALLRDKIDGARVIDLRSAERTETVVFEVVVERPQECAYSIKRIERVSATFFEGDDIQPEVLALRLDFPTVPHLNLRPYKIPKSLCLYQESYRDQKRHWTAYRFVARIQDWLAQTAEGILHDDDQPLEPVLFGGNAVLLFPAADDSEAPLQIVPLSPSETEESGHALRINHVCETRTHGVIQQQPKTLEDLAGIAGASFLPRIREFLKGCADKNEKFLSANAVFLVHFPKRRTSGAFCESVETWAFQTRLATDDKEKTVPAPVRDLGEAIGIWTKEGSTVALTLPVSDDSLVGATILLDVLNPIRRTDVDALARLNGRNREIDPTICAVGVGALGSQIVVNFARAGYGKRVALVDDDILLPHNVARHALPGAHYIGGKKSDLIADFVNTFADGENLFRSIPANVFNPTDRADQLREALRDSDVILDMSASATVSRYLAHENVGDARRISLFMSPSGNDLVLLAEDKNRSLQLDQIEMQYYRACVQSKRLRGHLDKSPSTHRYGQSCRDLSSQLPQHFVALHSAIGAKAIEETIAGEGAQVTVWRATETGEVCRVDVPVCPATRISTAGWTIVIDDHALADLFLQRQEKLPNETGGVLLGAFDLERRTIYITDTIPSPPDSEEWPTLYIRGRSGLKQKVDEMADLTDGMLEYLGEWHSHPEGSAPEPSAADGVVFRWITEIMDTEGLPAVMLIVGHDGAANCFITELVPVEHLFKSDEKNA